LLLQICVVAVVWTTDGRNVLFPAEDKEAIHSVKAECRRWICDDIRHRGSKGFLRAIQRQRHDGMPCRKERQQRVVPSTMETIRDLQLP